MKKETVEYMVDGIIYSVAVIGLSAGCFLLGPRLGINYEWCGLCMIICSFYMVLSLHFFMIAKAIKQAKENNRDVNNSNAKK